MWSHRIGFWDSNHLVVVPVPAQTCLSMPSADSLFHGDQSSAITSTMGLGARTLLGLEW